MADAHDPRVLTGDDEVDELSLLWVVTDRRLPGPGLEFEEATICYGNEYPREDYEKGYWAQEALKSRAPTAKNIAYMILKYCAQYDVDYVQLVRKYGS